MMKSTLFTPLFTFLPTKHKPPLHKLTTTNYLTTATASPLLLPPPTSAYIHIPFCRKRCHYCDFPIIALGSNSTHTATDDPRITNYIELLNKEILHTPFTIYNDCPFIKTVFFGGGTPSLVSPGHVSSVLDTLRSKFGVSDDAEVSMEMDPGTFDSRKLEELVSLGVNRVSLGVQAFQDQLLKGCGRSHGVSEIFEAIEVVKSCGVVNWSLDLISSLPYQTLQMWEESLRLCVDAQPVHVSVYDLQVEQGTKFGNWYTPGEFPLPSETQSAEFYKTASRMLTNAGYNHYEISSYCKDGFECKHNYTYWKNMPFYGFGLGAASYINGVRFSRPKKLKDYIDYVENMENRALDGNNHIDTQDLAVDTLMLSLRTAKGLDVQSFKKMFGSELVWSLCEVYKPYIESGHVVFSDQNNRAISLHELNGVRWNIDGVPTRVAYIRLSDPEGFLLSNELISLAFGVITP